MVRDRGSHNARSPVPVPDPAPNVPLYLSCNLVSPCSLHPTWIQRYSRVGTILVRGNPGSSPFLSLNLPIIYFVDFDLTASDRPSDPCSIRPSLHVPETWRDVHS